jgi:hypothetical protein
VAGTLAAKNFEVTRSPDSDADRTDQTGSFAWTLQLRLYVGVLELLGV